MKKIVAIILAVVIVAAGAYWLGTQNTKPAEAVEPTPPISEPTPTPTPSPEPETVSPPPSVQPSSASGAAEAAEAARQRTQELLDYVNSEQFIKDMEAMAGSEAVDLVESTAGPVENEEAPEQPPVTNPEQPPVTPPSSNPGSSGAPQGQQPPGEGDIDLSGTVNRDHDYSNTEGPGYAFSVG